MKKTVVLILALVLLATVGLSSCGSLSPAGSADDDAPLTRIENTGSAVSGSSGVSVPDFYSIMAGNGSTDTVWGLQDAAARQQIIDSAKADGFDVSFGSDGSMTVKNEDGTIYVQKPDGTWTMQGENGQSAQLGGDWPDNNFTKLLPKPDFQLAGTSTSESEFSAAFQSVNADQVRSYAAKVKEKGFNIDAEETDQNVYGIVVYSYSASNADGYRVEISFASGTGAISISK